MDTRSPFTPSPAVPPEGYARLSLAQQTLVALFMVAALFYLGWRPGTFNPEAMGFSVLIYGAELFGFTVAVLYLVMCWRLKTRTAPPPLENATVAVFIPTINESVDLVRRTLLAAQRMEYATEVWLLDDGNRAEMRALAGELGCRYLARTENSHAKAGNLNNALRHTTAEYIAIFDADHAPAPEFLRETLGFFRDEEVAFVQTPQDFYNLDSFQHRLDREDSLVWSEQTLFFRVIQAGKDRLNSAFFCGSCAVVRRKALDDIGGFATGTVTEDIHTSIKLHKRGWRSVYYARSLAFGLAPSTVIPFLKQRLRWGQGAMQVWRQEGILFSRGLRLGQRLSYLATMLAYFEGWQRVILFLAPVVVLTTGIMPVLEINAEFLLRFIPYYLLTFWVFEEVGRGYGRSLLTEQYNMIRFAVFITATFGFFLRKLRFVVTPKEMGQAEVTRRSLWPQYLVVAMNGLAIPTGIALHWFQGNLPLGALVANVLWAAAITGIGAIAIRFSLRIGGFQRREYRFPLPLPLRLKTPRGPAVGLATDISPLGFRLAGLPAGAAAAGDCLEAELLLPTGAVPLEARVKVRLPAEGPCDGETQDSLGCEISRIAPGDRNRLELFLFGSDLQWQLNGLADRVRTPLERLAGLVAGSARARTPAPRHWWPLLSGEGTGARTMGYISGADPRRRERTVVALAGLQPSQELRGEELTPAGRRKVSGSVVDERVIETHGAPLFLYRLTA